MKYRTIFEEIPFAHDSKIWDRRAREIDPNGDPLDLMVRAEEGDEEAADLLK